MRLNIFKIQGGKSKELQKNLIKKGYIEESSGTEKSFFRSFYIKEDLDISIWWVKSFSIYLKDSKEKMTNKIYSSVLVYESSRASYVITFGKSHFYVREFCDTDFGTRIAKKIADKNEVKMLAVKKFNEKKKKEIRSYVDKNKIDIDGGESTDYIQASILNDYRDDFGNKAKFGESVIFSTHKLFIADDIVSLLEKLVGVEKLEDKFKLPKALECIDQSKILELDKELTDTVYGNSGDYDFSLNSYNLVGADFVFSGNEKYVLYTRNATEEFDELSIDNLIDFIKKYAISKNDFYSMKVKILREETGNSGYTKLIKECLDFTSSKHNVILDHGKWRELNQDYIESLNESVDEIESIIEHEHKDISLKKLSKINETNKWEGENEFNKSLEKNGYTNTDKNFNILGIGSGYKIEAWDLQKDDTVYAVKFGTAKGLSYVCDQAMATLEIIKSIEKHKNKLTTINAKKFCLWLGFSNINRIEHVSTVDSLILKQKLQAWKKTCEKTGVVPLLKISKVSKE